MASRMASSALMPRASAESGWLRSLALARHTGSESKARQPRFARRSVDKDVCRFYVFMDETALVQMPQRRGNPHDLRTANRPRIP